MKKFLLIFPPAWYTLGPHIAIPSLAAQMKAANYDVEIMDLNIKFFNDILTQEYLTETIYELKKQYQDLQGRQNEILNDEILLEKYNKLNIFFKNIDSKITNLPVVISRAKEIIKNENLFYNPQKIVASINIINMAMELVSLRYYPMVFSLGDIRNPKLLFHYENIKNSIFSETENIFLNYYQKYVEEIKNKNVDFVGISINAHVQLIPALTLAFFLKKNTNAHISIGGNYLTRLTGNLKKYPEFFDLFADSVSYAEGENSILELAEYIEGKRNIEEVSNLIYKKGDDVVINDIGNPVLLSEIKIPDFEGYDFEKYLSPEVVLPLQMNRGCYWKKCTFCDIAHGQTFSVKKIDELINEIKYYQDKYHTRYFYVIDEAIHPNYLDKLADAILEQNIDVKFIICARFEEEFTFKLLKKIKRAGFIHIQWGVETGSKRVLSLMNKGIKFENIKKILRNANKVGIWNHAFAIWDFPSETYKEALDTLNLIFKNTDVIHSLALDTFGLSRHSCISKEPEKYEMKIVDIQEDFSTYLDIINLKMSNDERTKINEKLKEKNKKYFGNEFRSGNILYHHGFLYLGHFGLKFVKNFKIKKK